jgi:hypothetical protein
MSSVSVGVAGVHVYGGGDADGSGGGHSLLCGGLMVVSNVMLVPAIVLCFRRGYAMDLALTVMMLLASGLYHACDAGWGCIEELHQHRIQDHFMCNSMLSWFVLTLVGVPYTQRSTILTLIMCTYALFADRWIDSLLFPAALGGFFVVYALARFLGMGRTLARLDVSDMAIAACLFVLAYVPYTAVDPADGPTTYALMHSLWHLLSMPAIYFTIEARDGVPVHRKIARRLREAREYVRAAQTATTTTTTSIVRVDDLGGAGGERPATTDARKEERSNCNGPLVLARQGWMPASRAFPAAVPHEASAIDGAFLRNEYWAGGGSSRGQYASTGNTGHVRQVTAGRVFQPTRGTRAAHPQFPVTASSYQGDVFVNMV